MSTHLCPSHSSRNPCLFIFIFTLPLLKDIPDSRMIKFPKLQWNCNLTLKTLKILIFMKAVYKRGTLVPSNFIESLYLKVCKIFFFYIQVFRATFFNMFCMLRKVCSNNYARLFRAFEVYYKDTLEVPWKVFN